MCKKLLEESMDDGPLRVTESLANSFSQMTGLRFKFISWDLDINAQLTGELDSDWKRMIFEFESLREYRAIKKTKEQVVLGNLDLTTSLVDWLAPELSPAPPECKKPALVDFEKSEPSCLVLWGPVSMTVGKKQKTAWLIHLLDG